MTDKELMRQALEALYNMVEDGDVSDKKQAMQAITCLSKRLAEGNTPIEADA